jgi:hypothetical protein
MLCLEHPVMTGCVGTPSATLLDSSYRALTWSDRFTVPPYDPAKNYPARYHHCH